VYTSNTGTANGIAQVQTASIDLIGGGPPDTFHVDGTPAVGTQNQATGGFIQVTGANHSYRSEVDQLLDPSMNTGNAPVQTIGDEAGGLYVMAKVTGDAAAVAAVLTEFNNASGDSQAPLLHANYDSLFGAGGFNLLYRQDNFAGAKVVNWGFTTNTGATIDQLAVVPEPATMGLLAFAGMGLLARRRRNA
jgi:hypothetical protein